MSWISPTPYTEVATISSALRDASLWVSILTSCNIAIAMMQDVKIETQRDASLRADEIVATSVYGVGEIHDTYGVELHYDSSIQ